MRVPGRAVVHAGPSGRRRLIQPLDTRRLAHRRFGIFQKFLPYCHEMAMNTLCYRLQVGDGSHGSRHVMANDAAASP